MPLTLKSLIPCFRVLAFGSLLYSVASAAQVTIPDKPTQTIRYAQVEFGEKLPYQEELLRAVDLRVTVAAGLDPTIGGEQQAAWCMAGNEL